MLAALALVVSGAIEYVPRNCYHTNARDLKIVALLIAMYQEIV